MPSLQQQKTYQNLLKAIPLAMQAYFEEIGIQSDRDVLFSTEKEKLHNFYPSLRCLAQELDFSYDMDISLPEHSDKALALYDLTGEILNQIDLSKSFAKGYSGIDFSVMNTASQLKNFQKFADTLTERTDKNITEFWLSNLSSLSKEIIINSNKNISSSVYDDIEDSELAYEIAEKTGISFDDDDKLSFINEILFKSCREALDQHRLPNLQKAADQLFLSLEDYDPENHPSLKSLRHLLENCMPPIKELIEEYQTDYTRAGNNLKNILAFDDQFQKNKFLSPSKIREIIFQKHLSDMKRPNIKAVDNIFAYNDNTDQCFQKLMDQHKKDISIQSKLLQKFARINRESIKWKEYEKRHEISDDPLLKNARKNLTKLILKQLVSARYDSDGKIAELPTLLKFGNEIENVLEEQADLDNEVLSHILTVSDMLVSIAEAANKYLGTTFDNKLLDHDTLEMIHTQKEIYPDEMDIISDYVMKFAQTCDLFFEKPENNDTDIGDLGNIKERVSALPDCAEKMEMQELINIYGHLLYGKFYTVAEERKEKTAEFFIGIHPQEYTGLQKKLRAMAEFYPEILDAGIESVARRINTSTVHDILLPFYQNKNPQKTYITLYEGDHELSPEAAKGLSKISGEFINSVIERHHTLLESKDISPDMIREIIEQINTDNMMSSFEQSLQQSSEELQKQIDIYNRFQNFKSVRRKTLPSEDLSKRLIIKNKMYYS